MKIFLLEDDYSLNSIIKSSLEDKGLFVQSDTSGYDAAGSVLNNVFDLYILDVNVPGFDGHEILKLLRKENPDAPVIIISAEANIENIEKSYEVGCDDFIKKPFSFDELYIRIKYHLKNSFKDKFDKSKIDLSSELSYDMQSSKLYNKDNEVELSQKENLLLQLFVKNLNNTVTIEEIHEYVWGSKVLESVSMRSLIHKLQKKLKSGMILNIRGVGYKMQSL